MQARLLLDRATGHVFIKGELMIQPVAAPSRPCLGCGQTDNHPKHQAVQPDGSSAYWHLDCHSLVDPPCESCSWQVADAKGAKGTVLQQHIIRIHEGNDAA